jgi:hypothetical protein
MVLALVPAMSFAAPPSYEFWDLRNADNITATNLDVTVDGVPLTVTRYTGYYAKDSNSSDQRINIYVPSNVTADSAILHIVNNSGWQSNSFPANTIANNATFSTTTGANPNINGLALKRGMILVSYGARSRSNAAVSGEYLGHSPATMTDTKAALRFLRYNYDNGFLAGKGNPDLVFVTGTSGGGALSTVLAASGDSPDYFPSLYEIGAAGGSYDGTTYTSTLSDAYIGTIAYCPIQDLPMADQAYEYTYNASRTIRTSNANVNGSLAPYADNAIMQASDWLANDFVSYINGFGLLDENGQVLTASYVSPSVDDPLTEVDESLAGTTGGTFKAAMQGLLEKGIEKAINEWNEPFPAGLSVPYSNADVVNNFATIAGTTIGGIYYPGFSSWLEIDGATPTDGIPAPGSVASIINLDRFLTNIPSSAVKQPPAFNGMGLVPATGQNENNLWGAATESYGYAHEFAWDHAGTAIAGQGAANSSITWDQYLQTDHGKNVALQMKMSSPIPYLNGQANIPYLQYATSSDVTTVAKYWYVRHGQADRDTSFAVQTLLYYSLLNNPAVEDLNFNFAWKKAHSGNYDTREAIAWLDSVLASIPTSVTLSLSGPSTAGSGDTVTYTVSITGANELNALNFTLDYAGLTPVSISPKSGLTFVTTPELTDPDIYLIKTGTPGLTAAGTVPVLEITFTAGAEGAASFAIRDIEVSRYDGISSTTGVTVQFPAGLGGSGIDVTVTQAYDQYDINHDGSVNLADLGDAARLYRVVQSDVLWTGIADRLDTAGGRIGNNVIDMQDLITIYIAVRSA